MESAARMCWGETVGKDTIAKGPERRVRRGWDFLWGATTVWAWVERECVSVGSAGLGMVFATVAEDWIDGSVGCGVDAVGLSC